MPGSLMLAAPVLALTLSAAVDETPISAPALEALGYELSQLSARGDFGLVGPEGESYRSRPPQGMLAALWVSEPADHTGDDIPELIIIQDMRFGRDVVHVFSLGSDGPAKILETNANASAFRTLAPGEPLPSGAP